MNEKRAMICISVIATVIMVNALVACGPQPHSTLVAEPSAAWTGPIPDSIGTSDFNWDNPILGTSVGGAAEASQHVGFKILVPKNLGNPVDVFVQLSNPNPRQRVMAFVFDHDTYGRVVLKEWLPDGVTGSFESFVANTVANDKSSLPGHADAVTIRGAIVALLTETEDRSAAALRWMEGGVVFGLKGPTLQRSEVIAVANGL